MRFLCIVFASFACLAAFAGGLASAQIGIQNETYLVRNVKTEAQAQTASQANQIAVRNAKLVGLAELFSRIVPVDHRSRIRVPSNEQLDQMVIAKFDKDTRSGISTFRLITDLEYDKDAVLAFLDASRIPYVDQEPQSLLIIPQLIDEQGEAKVFDPSNDWLEAVKGRVSPNSVAWTLPEDTETNAALLSASLIEFRFVEEVASAQELTGAYIARVTKNADGSSISLQAVRVGDATGPSRFEKRYSLSSLSGVSEGATTNDLYNMALSDLTNAVTDEWLSTGQVVETRTNSINIVVLGLSTQSWFGLEALLERDRLVDSAEFIQTRQGALDVTVRFRAGLDELQLLFTDLGYRFEAYNLINQPDVVGFLLQQNGTAIPQGVNILDMSLIQLNY